MKKFVQNISNGGLRLFNSDFSNILTKEVYDAIGAILTGIGEDVNYVVSGCEITTVSGTTTIASGFLFLNGDIVRFNGWSGTLTACKGWITTDSPTLFTRVFKNLSVNDVHTESKARVSTTNPGGATIPFTCTSVLTMQELIALMWTQDWKNIPYDNAAYPYDYSNPDDGSNGNYAISPPWASMTGTYTKGSDADTHNMQPYNSNHGSDFDNSTAKGSRIQYKKFGNGMFHVKGTINRAIKATGTVLNFQDLTTGVTVSETTRENTVLHGTTIDNSLMWMYPMIGLNLTDIDKSGVIDCQILADTETSNPPSGFLSDTSKIASIKGLFYFSKNSLRLYSAESLTGLTNNGTYTITVFINGVI